MLNIGGSQNRQSKKSEYLTIFVAANLAFFLTAAGIYLYKYGATSYVLGEMLINYEYGIIRRGLLGTVVLNLSDYFGVNVIKFCNLLLLAAYSVLYSFIVYRLRFHLLALLFVIVTPFGFFFIINDWVGYGYKDVFVLLFYSGLLAILRYKADSRFYQLLFYTGILVVSLLHEGFLFFSIPFLVLFIPASTSSTGIHRSVSGFIRSNQKRFLLIAYTLVLAGGIFFITNTDKTAQVESLKLQYQGIVSGLKPYTLPNEQHFYSPVEWLNVDFVSSIKIVYKAKFSAANLIRTGIFGLLLLAAIGVLLLSVYEASRIFSYLKRNFLFLLYGFLSIGFLFILALDWGRWFYLVFMHIVIYLCFIVPNRNHAINRSLWYGYFLAAFYLLLLFIKVPVKYSGIPDAGDKPYMRKVFELITK